MSSSRTERLRTNSSAGTRRRRPRRTRTPRWRRATRRVPGDPAAATAATAGPAAHRSRCRAAPPRPASPGPPLDERLQRGGVLLGDDRGAGEHRTPTAEDVAIGLQQPQLVHGVVTLEVGLLVNGEPDGTRLDQGEELLIQVERADF